MRAWTAFSHGGIDPDSEASATGSQPAEWPSRDEVRRFADGCDALILEALANAPLEQPGHPLLHAAQAVYAILEHEAMHQEAMLYMWHQLPYEQKDAPAGISPDGGRTTPSRESVGVPAGRTTLGGGLGDVPFGWDNEFPAHVVDVPAFAIDSDNVGNEHFMDFVEAEGYQRLDWWTPEAFAWIRQEGIAHPRWTCSPFAPFEGFKAMASYPEYSADFFDGQHFVMKGASSATAAELLRRGLRNWFRPTYPYAYATFRCVTST